MGNATNRMLCWEPGTDQVALVPWPDYANRSRDLLCSFLACDSEVHDMTPVQRKLIVFVEAMHIIVRDGCDPTAVHRALLGLKEYRDCCASDMPGCA